MASKSILRITMFKIPDAKNVDAAIAAYERLGRENKKDGAPYVTVHARKIYQDPRAQGFTLCAQSNFKSLEDMRYYDEQCEAHLALKKVVGPMIEGPREKGVMTVYMDV